ncbi:hypothetical protein F441_19245 [Phytophthora nicotianae CJ01A1]|uniref:Uncharacterized protein n=5 Tax=Phytophthora nicotianae TaxID=4792 RepID=W2QX67_PHYN3|nr:hypothetical protein PPTG_05503 [Phytophthora nicotianae INRA-310]ETI33988.1 hypothetical protein F443_19427 [Phytophthora nicotianae P1569]ETK74339.1 hypothetical protein L915_18847 [Phytophthora nicotianae]ETP03874.1 hypothetical protein F441_19245 [Phytophthora nicotianae CJ01A1]ETP32021.1 hypothetical protein F442_19197 [Phytophthora nicotianae P10297]ETL27770.1 hypothetical protein L916_18742 [Phytophthora nicotianae]
MSSGDDALAKLRARMAQPPKDWVDVVMVAVLKDPMFYGVLGLSIFLVLAIIALFATKVLLDQIAAEDKLKERQKSKKQQ